MFLVSHSHDSVSLLRNVPSPHVIAASVRNCFVMQRMAKIKIGVFVMAFLVMISAENVHSAVFVCSNEG